MALGRLGALALTSTLLTGVLASCSSTARITDVYTALDSAGERKRNVFSTDSKEIHCVIEAGIGRPGVTIETLYRQLQAYDFETAKFFETDRVIAQAEFAPGRGSGLTIFSTPLQVLGPDGQPADDVPFLPGRFMCEVRLDGKLEGVAIFNIDFPECPVAEIIANKPCFGYFQDGRRCPRYGLTSRDPASCACDRAKGWECR